MTMTTTITAITLFESGLSLIRESTHDVFAFWLVTWGEGFVYVSFWGMMQDDKEI